MTAEATDVAVSGGTGIPWVALGGLGAVFGAMGSLILYGGKLIKDDVKADLAGVKKDLKADLAGVKADLAGVKADFKTDLAASETRLKADLAASEKRLADLINKAMPNKTE